jgi:hypothetical protein
MKGRGTLRPLSAQDFTQENFSQRKKKLKLTAKEH